jgi:prolipoprotein diacylglyceryltransferase
VPIAVIAFDFDPLIRLTDDLVVRWQTLALAAVIAACLIVAGWGTRRSSLRPDDLLLIVIGAVPGAIVLGRIGYAIDHWDAYGPDPLRLLDSALGGLDLAAGVVGGVLAGAYVASLLGASISRWSGLAALPLLMAIGAGKLTMMLGGSGQGVPSGATWATAYLGPGPWGSLAPALPSTPSQAYEGIATVAWVLVLVIVTAVLRSSRRDPRLLLIGIAGWAFLRAAISTTWRDPVVVGSLGMAGVLSVVVGVGALGVLVVMVARARRAPPATDGSTAIAWPDPSARPRF